MIRGLEARLAALATAGETITYGALARDLGLTGPGTIAQLTTALETLMEADVAAQKPLRAALCRGRLTGDLPAPGFFDKVLALGLTLDDQAVFTAAHRAAVFAAAR